jgi:RNA polymerase sigma-70 factor (ECF subfamily)
MRKQTIIESVNSYKDKLFRFSLKIVGNRFDAEDVLQELLIKVWKKREHFEELENKEAWCMTVVRNLSIDKIRKRKNNYADDISEHYAISDSAPTPDKATEVKESLSIVMLLLNELPEAQKEIIHLRDIEGYTYREISEITEMSEDQVKVNLFRARQKFKEKIKNLNFQR